MSHVILNKTLAFASSEFANRDMSRRGKVSSHFTKLSFLVIGRPNAKNVLRASSTTAHRRNCGHDERCEAILHVCVWTN